MATDPLGRGKRWVPVGRCLCEDTPELRALLAARNRPVRSWLRRAARHAVAHVRHAGRALWAVARHF